MPLPTHPLSYHAPTLCLVLFPRGEVLRFVPAAFHLACSRFGHCNMPIARELCFFRCRAARHMAVSMGRHRVVGERLYPPRTPSPPTRSLPSLVTVFIACSSFSVSLACLDCFPWCHFLPQRCATCVLVGWTRCGCCIPRLSCSFEAPPNVSAPILRGLRCVCLLVCSGRVPLSLWALAWSLFGVHMLTLLLPYRLDSGIHVFPPPGRAAGAICDCVASVKRRMARREAAWLNGLELFVGTRENGSACLRHAHGDRLGGQRLLHKTKSHTRQTRKVHL